MPTIVPSNPGWFTGYIPSSEEWAHVFSGKVDFPAPINQGGTGAQTAPLANYNLQQRTIVPEGYAVPLTPLTRYGVATSTGHATLILPALASLQLGDWVDLADTDGQAATNTVTIQASGSDEINLFGTSASTQQINTDYGAAVLVVTSAGWVMFSPTAPAPAIGSIGGTERWTVYLNGVAGTITTEQLATFAGGGTGGVSVTVDGTTITPDIVELWFPGATITIPASGIAEIVTAGGGGGSPWQLNFLPQQNAPPITDPALVGTVNQHPVLQFWNGGGSTIYLTAIFAAVLPEGYAGGNLVVDLWWACPVATTGNVAWNVAVEREEVGVFNLGTDSFASPVTSATVNVPGTVLEVVQSTVTLTAGTETNGVLAGELFRLNITFDYAGSTIAGGDAVYLVAASMVEA